MKTLAPGLQDHLNGGATTLCWCWKLTRRDGLVQGFTDHDRSVTFDDVTYGAASGFSASDVQSLLDLAVDNLTLAGALSADCLNEDDLARGLYDNAGIEIWRVNWADPAMRALLRTGNIGEVTRNGSAFQAELRGLAHILGQPVGRAYGHLCDADLGDAHCTLALGALTHAGVVALVSDALRFSVTGLDVFADGYFTGGKLSFTSGANAGQAMEVKQHGRAGTAITIELWQPLSEAIAPGDGFTLSAGCDKQFSTCQTKFSNLANFRGFPYMPGNDAVLASPGANQILDGGSRYEG